MRYPVIFCILLAMLTANAQDKYVEREFAWVDVHSAHKVTWKTPGGYLIASAAKSYDLGRWNSYIVEVSPDFAVTNVAGDAGSGLLSNISDMVCGTDGNNCLAVGYNAPDDWGNRTSQLMLYENGAMEYFSLNDYIYNNALLTCERTVDKGYLLGGKHDVAVSAPYWDELYLIKLDSLYNQVWDTVYYGLPYGNNSYIKDMLANPDGSFHLLATVEDFYGDPSGRVLLMHIDPAGNILNQTTYDLGDNEETFHLMSTNDGGLMLTANNNINDIPIDTTFILKLDEAGAIEWQIKQALVAANQPLYAGYTLKTLQLANGEYVLAGSYYPQGGAFLDAAILKLDTAGNLLWQRSYGGPYHDYAYDMIFEADDSTGKSGYVICGRKDLGAGGHANVYFLKLNCMGLLEEPHAEFAAGVAPPGNDPLLVQFQNLSKYVYPDSIDGGFYLWDFGDGTPPLAQHSDTVAVPLHQYPEAGVYHPTLTAIVCNDTATHTQTLCVGEATPEFLYAPTPGVGHSVSFTNHSHLGADPYTVMEGVYLWDFGDGNQSAEMHPAHVYHAPGTYVVTLTAVFCTDTVAATQTVVVEAVGINSPDRGCGICVLPPTPNPAKAGSPIRIGLEFPHFIANKTATLRLYDPNGRLLHEGRQSGSGHYALPTSGLPAGLYLYGVEWEGNVLARGKVAVF